MGYLHAPDSCSVMETRRRIIPCYSGFGNAAGLLAQYGLLGGKQKECGEYSNDSDSETEEYKELEPDINPVTGELFCSHYQHSWDGEIAPW